MDNVKTVISSNLEIEQKSQTSSHSNLSATDNKLHESDKFSLRFNTRDILINSIKKINNDIDLKILGKLLYNTKKYYCELECKLFDNSFYEKYKREEISDIDIYGVFFDFSLQVSRVGFECKNTMNNGVDEILKIKGIQAYNNLDRVGLIKKKLANNVRLVAEKIEVQLYDEKEIEKIVTMLVPEYKIKFEEEKLFYKITLAIETEIKNQLKGTIAFIKGTFWTSRPYQNIHTIVRLLEHIRENRNLALYQYKYLSTKLSLLLSISILEICSIIIKTNLANMEQVALDQLFGSSTERWEKFRTYDLISQELGKKISPYPPYTKDYINLVSWIISNMNESSQIPLCLEEYLKCYLLNLDYNSLSLKFSPITLKLAKDFLRFITNISKQDNSFYEEVYKI